MGILKSIIAGSVGALSGLSLKLRTTIVFSLILIVSLGLNTAVLSYMAIRDYKDSLRERADKSGCQITNEVQSYISIGMGVADVDRDSIEKKMSDIIANDGLIAHMIILDENAKPVSMSGRPSEKDIDAASSAVKALAEGGSDSGDNMLSIPIKGKADSFKGALVIGLNPEIASEKTYSLLIWALVAAPLGIGLAVVVVYQTITRLVIRPINEVRAVTSEIASGNLGRKLPADSDDEMSGLAKSVNSMSGSLGTMVSQISSITYEMTSITSNLALLSKRTAGAVSVQNSTAQSNAEAAGGIERNMSLINESVRDMAAHSESAASAAAEMASSIKSVSERIDSFDGTTQETASSIEEMTASMKEISSALLALTSSMEAAVSSVYQAETRINDVQGLVEKSTSLAMEVTKEAKETGLPSAEAAAKSMEHIGEKMDSIMSAATDLGRRTDQIGKITNVIHEITDRTNLLALNAAILAAQAGEHGKGFAVVADEIKDLAEKTASSTKEISGIVASLRKEAESSIEHVRSGVGMVEEGMTTVWRMADVLGRIHRSSESSTEMATVINRAMTEVTGAVKGISATVRDINEQMSFMNRALDEQNKGSLVIYRNTEEVRSGSNMIRKSVSELTDASMRIAGISENLRDQSSAIAAALSEQKTENDSLLASVSSIRDTARGLADISKELEGLSSVMNERAERLGSEIKKFKF